MPELASTSYNYSIFNLPGGNNQGRPIISPTIHCLARRGGVKRISTFIQEKTRRVLKVLLEIMIRDVVTHPPIGRP
uniref:Histone H4 n=1 Tax=Timema poppense TaxID=170557 RepID=A0A7R9DEB2_TIMPO|nr:unnamed protein product [Timema poppensis]